MFHIMMTFNFQNLSVKLEHSIHFLLILTLKAYDALN